MINSTDIGYRIESGTSSRTLSQRTLSLNNFIPSVLFRHPLLSSPVLPLCWIVSTLKVLSRSVVSFEISYLTIVSSGWSSFLPFPHYEVVSDKPTSYGASSPNLLEGHRVCRDSHDGGQSVPVTRPLPLTLRICDRRYGLPSL